MQILGRLERIFYRVFLVPHASGVHVVAIGLLLHAGSVRPQESGPPPRLCGEIFLVAAMPLQVNSWNSWLLFLATNSTKGNEEETNE